MGQYDNVSLVDGSGFGSADDVWEYLTGNWSAERFGPGVQPMPFDGFLFASHVVVSSTPLAAAATIKFLMEELVCTSLAWEGLYHRGILTV